MTPAGALWDVLISSMSGLIVEIMWMSIWSISASPWTAMWSPEHLHLISRGTAAISVADTVKDHQWSWWYCLVHMELQCLHFWGHHWLQEPIYNFWSGRRHCVNGCACRYSTSCSLRLVSPGCIPRLFSCTATAEKSPSLGTSLTKKASLLSKWIQNGFTYMNKKSI